MGSGPSPFGSRSNRRSGILSCAPPLCWAHQDFARGGRSDWPIDHSERASLRRKGTARRREAQETVRRGWRALWPLFIVGFGVLLDTCQQEPFTTPQAVFELEERTLPPGGTIVSLTGPIQDETGVRAEWELETRMSWTTYTQWVSRKLRKDLRADPLHDYTLTFRKSLPGDEVTLRLVRRPSGNLLRVLVTFTADPS